MPTFSGIGDLGVKWNGAQVGSRSAMEAEMGDLAVPVSNLMYAARERSVSFERWCQCTRLLLGREDQVAVRPDLYAAGLTPLAAVRVMVLGRAG